MRTYSTNDKRRENYLFGGLMISIGIAIALSFCACGIEVEDGPSTDLTRVCVNGMAIHDNITDYDLSSFHDESDRYTFPTKAPYMQEKPTADYPEISNYGFEDMAVQTLGDEIVYMTAEVEEKRYNARSESFEAWLETQMDVRSQLEQESKKQLVTICGKEVTTVADVESLLGMGYEDKMYDRSQLMREMIYADYEHGIQAEILYHESNEITKEEKGFVDYLIISSMK